MYINNVLLPSIPFLISSSIQPVLHSQQRISKPPLPPTSANPLSQSKRLPVSQISAKMQFQSIIAVLSFALVATSVPTGTSDTTVCTGDNKASYCSKTKSGNGLSGLVGALLTIVVPVEVSNILTCTTGMLNTIEIIHYRADSPCDSPAHPQRQSTGRQCMLPRQWRSKLNQTCSIYLTANVISATNWIGQHRHCLRSHQCLITFPLSIYSRPL